MEEQLLDASKALFSSRVLLILALALSKISIVTLIRQIFTIDTREAWVAANALIAVLAGWALMSIIAFLVGCPATATTNLSEGLCRDESLLWYLVFILDAMTEFATVILIYWLMRPLTVSRRLKMIVATAFSARIPVAAMSLAFLHSTLKFLHRDHTNWPLAITDSVIWQEVLVGCSLISATVPCLRPFVKRFHTGGLAYVTGLGKLSELTESRRTMN